MIPELLDWIKAMDNFFDYMEIPKEMQVKIAAHKLRGGASALWDRIQSIRRRHGELEINSWEIRKRIMFEQFLPPYQQRHEMTSLSTGDQDCCIKCR